MPIKHCKQNCIITTKVNIEIIMFSLFIIYIVWKTTMATLPPPPSPQFVNLTPNSCSLLTLYPISDLINADTDYRYFSFFHFFLKTFWSPSTRATTREININ